MKAQDLKNSILQLAVQGKLVEQDPDDEPASVLLERIREERAELIKQKKIKKPKGGESVIYREGGSWYERRGKSDPVCIDDEIPFDIPDSWEWTRLASVTYAVGGKQNQILAKEIKAEGKFPVVSQGQALLDGYCDDAEKVIYDIPLVMFGDHTRNVKYIDFEFVIGADGTKFHKSLGSDPRFLYYWMLYASSRLRNRGYARHYALLNAEFLPIPPLAEQRRIVDRVDELMPLVEEYGVLEDARRALDAALPERLRKSVLQMAVQGKLIEQDPADEPASALLERIRQERAELIKQKKVKVPKGGESVIYREGGSWFERRGKSDPVCIDDEIPFDIPESWEWTRLGGLGDWKAGATPTKGRSEYYRNGTIPWLLTGDLTDGIVTDIPNMITETALKECSVRLNPVGSILVAMYGATIGKIGILTIPATTNQACCACILHNDEVRGWLVAWLKYQKPHFVKLGEGGAQPNISREKIVSRLVPIPPLAEQCRIVERVDEILRLIDG